MFTQIKNLFTRATTALPRTEIITRARSFGHHGFEFQDFLNELADNGETVTESEHNAARAAYLEEMRERGVREGNTPRMVYLTAEYYADAEDYAAYREGIDAAHETRASRSRH